MTATQALTIIIALIPFVAPPIIGLVTVLVKNAMDKLPVNSRPVVAQVVQTAVVATEQIANDQLNGAGKKEIAVQKVQEQLAHLGLNVPASVVSSMIEESVAALPKVGDAIVAGTSVPAPVVDKPAAPLAGQVQMKAKFAPTQPALKESSRPERAE